MKTHLLAAALVASGLSACVSSSTGDTLVQLPSDVASRGYVQEVALSGSLGNTSEGFSELFKTRVADKLKACAKGKHKPLRLDVSLTEFKRANPAMTYLVGSSNMIKGSAKLVDPASGAVVADFDVTRSVGGGGLIAAAAMANAEEQMSDAFGDDVCKRAFIAR